MKNKLTRKQKLLRRKKQTHRRKKIKKNRQKGGNESVFHFHCNWNYGDNILNLKFFYNISDILKEKGIQIEYYYSTDYIKNKIELERYVDDSVVHLRPISEQPERSVDLWMGNPLENIEFKTIEPYYNLMYKKILKDIGLSDLNIDTSLFQKEAYLQDVYNRLDEQFKNVDILFINGKPVTDRIVYDKEKMDELAIKLAEKYKIVTTETVNDTIPSTRTKDLNIQDIGAISTHAKYIISVHTGPLTSCYNADTQSNVKKWFLLNSEIDRIDYKEIPVIYINGPEEFSTIIEYFTQNVPS
jgi:hypothetical protein